MHKSFHHVPSPPCSCCDTDQTTEHVLQDNRSRQQIRDEIWPTPADLQEKVYGPADALGKTSNFIQRAVI